MHDLIIIGAGLGGIALAAEAFASGIEPSQILILEKGADSQFGHQAALSRKKANYGELQRLRRPLRRAVVR